MRNPGIAYTCHVQSDFQHPGVRRLRCYRRRSLLYLQCSRSRASSSSSQSSFSHSSSNTRPSSLPASGFRCSSCRKRLICSPRPPGGGIAWWAHIGEFVAGLPLPRRCDSRRVSKFLLHADEGSSASTSPGATCHRPISSGSFSCSCVPAVLRQRMLSDADAQDRSPGAERELSRHSARAPAGDACGCWASPVMRYIDVNDYGGRCCARHPDDRSGGSPGHHSAHSRGAGARRSADCARGPQPQREGARSWCHTTRCQAGR